MSKIFNPSINGIYFKNYDIIEDFEGMRRVRGDLYYCNNGKSIKVGTYNPAYQENENDIPVLRFNIEDDHSYIREDNSRYESLFNKNMVPLAEYDCPVGLTELLFDLEIITYLYSFMHQIRPKNDFEVCGLAGIINGHMSEKPTIKVISIKGQNLESKDQIIEFVKSQAKSIALNNNYPIRVFASERDFTIIYINGKQYA